MAFNFKNADVVKEKFVRKSNGISKGQRFNLKFRPYLSTSGQAKAEKEGLPFVATVSHEFRFSDDYMTKFDLQNHSVAVIVDRDDDGLAQSVALAITPEGHKEANTFKKKGEAQKSALFTHHFLMVNLAEAGTIQVPELNEDKTPIDEEDELLGSNQLLDLEYVVDVASITASDDDYMEPVEEGTGIALYEVIQGEEVEAADVEFEEEVEA